MFAYTILLCASTIFLVGAGPVRRALSVHDTRDAVPHGYTALRVPPDDTMVPLRIALTPKDMPGLTKVLYDVSTPGSSNYGNFLTLEEIKGYSTPAESTTSAVLKWLADNDINATPSGAFSDWLSIVVPLSKANTLLNARFTEFFHEPSGTTAIRTMQYSIPNDLRDHIELVHPTTSFVAPLSRSAKFTAHSRRALPADPSCNSQVTPTCLQELYGIPATPATQSSLNQLAVSGFIDQFAQTADLSSFLTVLRPDIDPNTVFSLQTIDDGENPQGSDEAGIEADLDTQYTVGIATGVPVIFISVGLNNPDGVSGFIDIADTLVGQDSPPQVLSTSYSFDEPDLGSLLATRMCNAYVPFGARGISTLFASGDGGVSGSQAQSCTTFIPTFPSTCPFVTSVGGTAGINEVTATFSGGGFSQFFPQPDYQNNSVPAYLSSIGTLNAGRFTASGRGFPDIAAQAENVEIVWAGEFGTVDGTSCSTPIFASIIALINDQLIGQNKSALGFLNPFIYANPGIWNDITSGNNPGCRTQGFPASLGWDAVTGLGTPDFARLLAAVGL
ncbi:family S53 protease-like protein [Mycena floridula]|nr:family S53 protease-like protein [Mycena floridula]